MTRCKLPRMLVADEPITDRRVKKRVVKVILSGFFISLAVVQLLAIGSGVIPITGSILLGCIFAIVALSALPALLNLRQKRSRFHTIVAIGYLANVVLTGWLFSTFVFSGFERGKKYGEGLAQSIASFKERTGEWPREITDIPIAQRPPETSFWPYGSDCSDRICDSVAGFFISYDLREQATPPELTIGRRDMRETWDWQQRRWQVD